MYRCVRFSFLAIHPSSTARPLTESGLLRSSTWSLHASAAKVGACLHPETAGVPCTALQMLALNAASQLLCRHRSVACKKTSCFDNP